MIDVVPVLSSEMFQTAYYACKGQKDRMNRYVSIISQKIEGIHIPRSAARIYFNIKTQAVLEDSFEGWELFRQIQCEVLLSSKMNCVWLSPGKAYDTKIKKEISIYERKGFMDRCRPYFVLDNWYKEIGRREFRRRGFNPFEPASADKSI